MSFADEEAANLAVDAPIGMLTAEEANARAELMSRRINACTQGLLEANTRGVEKPSDAEVRFLHRTVKDYLERQDVWTKICTKAFEERPVLSCD
jgi:hypothetical protein